MEKLKSVFSSSTSTASAKLVKAFKFDKIHNVLKRNNGNGGGYRNSIARNPFLDGPSLEEPSLPRPHIIIHIVAIFFTFLSICCTAAVAAFQSKWFTVSGGTGFTLFILLLSFILSIFLLVVPIVYDRWDRLKRPAQFLNQTRTTFILHTFGTFLMLLASFIVTISAFTEAGCKDPDNDPHSSLGDTFKSGLKSWCRTKKASAFFNWFSFIAWGALLVLTALIFRRERRSNRREPGFIPPADSGGISYSTILAADDERYADKQQNHQSASQSVYDTPQTAAGGYGGDALSRPSVDAYGAFDGDSMPQHFNQADEPSRTMQLAYNDPYAQIRASLMNQPQSASGYAQPPQQMYGNGGLPNPPQYNSGYR